MLSAFRHDFVERQFIYCLDRIEKLENDRVANLEKKVEDLEKVEKRRYFSYFLTIALMMVGLYISYQLWKLHRNRQVNRP